jgi:hypothetical protein
MTKHLIPILFISVLKSQWQAINQPTTWENGTIDIIKAQGNQLYTVTNQAQVYTSNDQAYSWEMLADTLETFPYGVDLLFIKNNAAFITQSIGGGPYNYVCLFDSGAWQELSYQSSALVSMVDNDSLIFTLLNGISISSDMGENWFQIPDPPISGYIKLNLATNEYLYISHGCEVYRTGDLGVTWEDITGVLDDEGFESPYNCSGVMSMVSHGDQLIISMYWGGGMGKLFVSNDNGVTWLIIDSLPLEHSISAMASKNNVLFIGTGSTNSGVFYTNDLINWIDFSIGLESYNYSVNQLVVTDYYLYKTGGTFETYQIPLSDLGTQPEKEKPTQFKIIQNYPNPFNPITTIKYDLPKATNVNISIYDMMGKEVKNLINTNQNSGDMSVIWNGTNNNGEEVSAGMYFYIIKTNTLNQTRKMILLK